VRSACQNGVTVDLADDTETPVQDTIPCTTEVCMGGVVRSLPNHAACEDADPCTTNTCTVTGCASVAISNCVPDAGMDAGVDDAGVDAGLLADAGVEDAGVADAGADDAGATVDAGGMMMADAGTPPVDAGMISGTDAGTDPGVAMGCGCSSLPAPWFWFGLVALFAARRRKP
jgi:uncharacterized protein (TIGR03382 family)